MKEYHITDDVVIYNDMGRGWAKGKNQPLWHRKVYNMWRQMWKRVYVDVHWFGSLIHPSFKYLSNYLDWIESQPSFEDFCTTCGTIMWSIDKDSKCPGNRDYYPEYMTLMPHSDNAKEEYNRNGIPNSTPTPKKPVLGVPLDRAKKVILTISNNEVSNYGFHCGAVSRCASKKLKFHKGYKWYKINYKHNRKYRIKGVNFNV